MGQQYAGINNKYGKKGHLYDLSAKLLSQTKGSFMVICLENSDKFYFLHRIKCNLQTVCKDMGWVIVHQQLFNRDLVIGMGLAEKGMSDMTIFRTKNVDIYKIWKDVLHFVFLGNGLPNIDYFSIKFNPQSSESIDNIQSFCQLPAKSSKASTMCFLC